MKLSTDWTRYYKKTPSYTSLTRLFSRLKIKRVLKKHIKLNDISICELGGGNSFIAETIINNFPVNNYHVVDSNILGLELFNKIHFSCDTSVECADIIRMEPTETYDLVFSIGLIEHFDTEDTKKAIFSHFNICNNGGFILVTFPTPTFLYSFVRFIAERLGIWEFPDERPLLFSEVEAAMKDRGSIIHKSINWGIILTQGYLLVKKGL